MRTARRMEAGLKMYQFTYRDGGGVERTCCVVARDLESALWAVTKDIKKMEACGPVLVVLEEEVTELPDAVERAEDYMERQRRKGKP